MKLKLAKYTLKKYEPKLGLYFFYNAKNKSFWNCDYPTGSVISALDGTISTDEVIRILASNNSDFSKAEFEEVFMEIFNFLLKEEFLVCVD